MTDPAKNPTLEQPTAPISIKSVNGETRYEIFGEEYEFATDAMMAAIAADCLPVLVV